MGIVVAVVAWLLTAVAVLSGHPLEAAIGLALAVLATAAAVISPRRVLARHDHVVDDGWARLDRELRRQRRHGRPLSIALLRLDEAPAAGMDHLAHRLGSQLRGDDFVFVADGLAHLVLPEVDTASAEVAVDRLSGVLHEQGISGTAALVAYPGDGLTVPALFERLATVGVRPIGTQAAQAPVAGTDKDAEPAEPSVPAPRGADEQLDLAPLTPTRPDPGARP